MKGALGFTLLVLAAACARLPDGQQRELLKYWPAGPGREKVVRVRGQEITSGGKWVEDGEFVFYDARGREIGRGSYRKGLEHGPWTRTFEDGDKGSGMYREGLRDGGWTYYYPDGRLQEEGAYVEGQRHGQWIRRHRNGEVEAELMYHEGKLQGPCTYWTEKGEKDAKRSGRYEKGEKVG